MQQIKIKIKRNSFQRKLLLVRNMNILSKSLNEFSTPVSLETKVGKWTAKSIFSGLETPVKSLDLSIDQTSKYFKIEEWVAKPISSSIHTPVNLDVCRTPIWLKTNKRKIDEISTEQCNSWSTKKIEVSLTENINSAPQENLYDAFSSECLNFSDKIEVSFVLSEIVDKVVGLF